MQYTLVPATAVAGDQDLAVGWVLEIHTSSPVHQMAARIGLPFPYEQCEEIRNAIVMQHWVEMTDERDFVHAIVDFFRAHPEWGVNEATFTSPAPQWSPDKPLPDLT